MPYRDDLASLEARRDELRHELADATRKADALAGALREREDLARELADVEARLLRTPARRLPLLDSIRIASPCNAAWDEMIGDDRVRFCGSCQKNVYDLSALAADDAERLLAEHEGAICVRLYRRADGTVLTADCPVGVRKKRVRRAVVAVAGAGALAAVTSGTFMHGDRCQATMGEMSPVRPIAVETPQITMGIVGPDATHDPPTMGSAAPEPPPPPVGQAKMGKPLMGRR